MAANENAALQHLPSSINWGLSSFGLSCSICSGYSLQVRHRACPQALTGLSAAIRQPVSGLLPHLRIESQWEFKRSFHPITFFRNFGGRSVGGYYQEQRFERLNHYICDMEMRVQIPFQQLLTVVKMLTPTQKAKLRKELDNDLSIGKEKAEFIEMLLNGPVYSEDEVKIIQENRNSIAAWRTKS